MRAYIALKQTNGGTNGKVCVCAGVWCVGEVGQACMCVGGGGGRKVSCVWEGSYVEVSVQTESCSCE